eukprot:6703495-Prymnesium_polylepis.1
MRDALPVSIAVGVMLTARPRSVAQVIPAGFREDVAGVGAQVRLPVVQIVQNAAVVVGAAGTVLIDPGRVHLREGELLEQHARRLGELELVAPLDPARRVGLLVLNARDEVDALCAVLNAPLREPRK